MTGDLHSNYLGFMREGCVLIFPSMGSYEYFSNKALIMSRLWNIEYLVNSANEISVKTYIESHIMEDYGIIVNEALTIIFISLSN